MRNILATAILGLAFIPVLAIGQTPTDESNANTKGESADFASNYPATKVGHQGIRIDYNRIEHPGGVFAIRVPGIYADIANTPQYIVNTEIDNGQITQGKGFVAAMSKTGRSRELKPGETVYVTKLQIKNNIVHFELLTTDQAVLGDGESTRYRAEVNFHIDNLQTTAKAPEVKKIIDAIFTDAASANTVQSKTVDIGMTAEQVKQALGNPDKIINLGPKTIFVYRDIKVIFADAKVADVQ
jgi:hypothetical protein